VTKSEAVGQRTMPGVSFAGLVLVLAVGFLAPLLVGLWPKIRVPAVVLEILLGILIGPSVLSWAKPDLPIQVLSVVGLGFLLFLAGLEVEPDHLRGPLLRLPLVGFVISLVLGLGVGLAL